MNANELADELDDYYIAITDEYTGFGYLKEAATMLRQQQAEIKDLNKENTDLRYLIATKLEQQDGIFLNSITHPITNTPEPSYEIDLDKLETIEIDLPSPEPVAWIDKNTGKPRMEGFIKTDHDIPLYTHPVKEELTDEEITQCLNESMDIKGVWGQPMMELNPVNFARAILRKASEK